MPELPEVETVKRGLTKVLPGQKIISFSSDTPKMLNYSPAKFQAKIIGRQIKVVDRCGKMIIIKLNGQLDLLAHLKMTGQLVYQDKIRQLGGGHQIKSGGLQLPNKFSHIILGFKNGGKLYFNDIRKFGWLKLFTDRELDHYLAGLKLGPEPLEKGFTLNYFQTALARRPKVKIKQFLMDNSNVVGIGNIYSDEICFFAGVRPDRPAGQLTGTEVKKLYRGINKILKEAINCHGTSVSDYVDAQGRVGSYAKKLKVYQRYGKKCYNCGAIIKKMKIGGRTASFCPHCQV